MLTLEQAKQIKKAIDLYFKKDDVITLEDVQNMVLIPQAGKHEATKILAIQYGDLTVMVWIELKSEHVVRVVKSMAW